MEPEFLDLEDVLLIHDQQLVRFGGSAGLRDRGLLESAVAMPQATFGGAFVRAALAAGRFSRLNQRRNRRKRLERLRLTT